MPHALMGLRVSLRNKRLLLTRPRLRARFARGTDQVANQKRKASGRDLYYISAHDVATVWDSVFGVATLCLGSDRSDERVR